MITKFICWFWGCKLVVKAFTGDTFDTTNRMTGQPETGHLYRWEVQPFCIRCGQTNKRYRGARGYVEPAATQSKAAPIAARSNPLRPLS